jgi:CRP/FNR family transcriptional regulator, cyclic AMP receptor protein
VIDPNARLDPSRVRHVARFRSDAKIARLKQSPLFEGLSRKQLARLAQLSDDLEATAGTVLCQEGARGREFFVILEGEATVTSRGRRIRTLGPGDFFGEIALLERVNRTATVTASTPLRFFVISDTAFKSVLATDPTIEHKLLRALARRVFSVSGDPATD